jgi:hypothetical protein
MLKPQIFFLSWCHSFSIFTSFLKLNPKYQTIMDQHGHKILIILVFLWQFDMYYYSCGIATTWYFYFLLILFMWKFIISNQDGQISYCNYRHLKRQIERLKWMRTYIWQNLSIQHSNIFYTQIQKLKTPSIIHKQTQKLNQIKDEI